MKKIVLFILMCLSFMPVLFTNIAYAHQSLDGEKITAISVAIDVSGSMSSMDSNKISLDLLKMIIDLCDEDDYVNITAYNDSIVCSSGLISLKSDKDKTALLKNISKLKFKGNTDNGLGLITATKAIADSKIDFDNSFVIFISDGNTELTGSNSDREIADSDKDFDESLELAKKNDITINSIEFTKKYTQDTSKISVVSAGSGGTSSIVGDVDQYIQVFLSTFFKEYSNSVVNWEEENTKEVLNRKKMTLDNSKKIDVSLIISTESILDFDVIDKEYEMWWKKGEHYVFASLKEEKKDEVTMLYSLNKEATVVVGHVSVDRAVYNTPIDFPQELPEEGVKIKEKKQFPQGLFNVILIVLIVVTTIIVCVVIVKKILFNEKKFEEFTGYLEARFIDIKSKNDMSNLVWKLSDFSNVGVTLEELFSNKGIKESLKDLDKVCFYPSDNPNEITIVHCIDGGIFIGEKIVKANTQQFIHSGDVIYISFADNSSELELRYVQSSPERNL